ncbi:HAD hydrolase, family IIID protein [Cardiosporidium cionae]|uniref:HAD hydrolase, family IIID protein n=1 Tax=Cardiosporidium cionae TaxID=476202 RepID=A0ABQ7J7T8_9APIC|nr:HAD hydrolase, family IIID protein [Cardiosporidium cionae]|eukprot:KAF8820004.1 HAD hydrolase, family IIID protein [Cardiosporidium cionae]
MPSDPAAPRSNREPDGSADSTLQESTESTPQVEKSFPEATKRMEAAHTTYSTACSSNSGSSTQTGDTSLCDNHSTSSKSSITSSWTSSPSISPDQGLCGANSNNLSSNVMEIESGTAQAEDDSCNGTSLHVKWGSKAVDMFFTPADFETFSLYDLKTKILNDFDIPLSRQRLLGISSNGAPAQETDLLSNITFKKENTFWLVGTPTEKAFVNPSEKSDLPDVLNDLMWDYNPTERSAVSIRTKKHLARLQKAIDKTNIVLINSPRSLKKLLVLDLDHTLFDFRGESLAISRLKRPYLDYFMRETYRDYDLVIWSQTHWRWVEAKCTELGFLNNPRYNLCFVLDRSSMFTVSSRPGGRVITHEVKALELIWMKFPSLWGPHNTLHIDDLGKNFAMNPKNGIKVSSYKAHKRFSDRELLELIDYLKITADLADVRQADHSDWKTIARLRPSLHDDASP